MTRTQLWITIILLALGTLTTRALPFVLFPDSKELPSYIKYLSNVLPFTIIGLLVIYCVKDVSVTNYPHGIPEAISIILIVILHLWKKNTLVSIACGTLFYMFLIQNMFI